MDWRRLFGDSVAGTLVRLVVLSIVVGVVISALGIDLRDIPRTVQLLVQRLYDLGSAAIEWLAHYFIIGAVIVVPVWLIVRLVRGRSEPRA